MVRRAPMIGAGENARSLTEFTLRSFAKAQDDYRRVRDDSRSYRMNERLAVISSPSALLRIDSARNLFPSYMKLGTGAVQDNTEARRLHGG